MPDICDCESKNESPYHAKNELQVSVDDICECESYNREDMTGSSLPSGPILVSFTPLEFINSNALLTFSAF
jgi:hypothetical protein